LFLSFSSSSFSIIIFFDILFHYIFAIDAMPLLITPLIFCRYIAYAISPYISIIRYFDIFIEILRHAATPLPFRCHYAADY
jgi:hypothetical protein